MFSPTPILLAASLVALAPRCSNDAGITGASIPLTTGTYSIRAVLGRSSCPDDISGAWIGLLNAATMGVSQQGERYNLTLGRPLEAELVGDRLTAQDRFSDGSVLAIYDYDVTFSPDRMSYTGRFTLTVDAPGTAADCEAVAEISGRRL